MMHEDGFSLLELLIVAAIVMILSAVIIFMINPLQQLGKARNSQRWSDVNTILNAIGMNKADNKGSFSCSSGAVPTSSTRMASSSPNYNIGPCLVPTYLPKLPFDPTTSTATPKYASVTDYNTGYNIQMNATTSQITVSAPFAEVSTTISVTQ